MAKDDYDYIVFKILTYLYGVLKRKIIFQAETFALITKDIDPAYLISILQMIQGEDLIKGLAFQKAWGQTYVLLNSPEDASITAKGIHYLKDNSGMDKVKNYILESSGAIAELVKIVLGI